MLQKPVIIHDRDAHGDTVEILKKYQGGLHSGIIHCFSGSREMARACLDMGFYIAFGGALTFTNARSLPEVCLYVPEDRLLIETDAPYLTPHPLRGKMNEPANVVLVAKKIAELKGCSVEEIGELTSRNACRLYGLAQPL